MIDNTGPEDRGLHTVCAVVTDVISGFFKGRRQRLKHAYAGLLISGFKAGDRWCLCVKRWLEAYIAGKAPKVVLEATHEKALDFVPLEELVKFAWKNV